MFFLIVNIPTAYKSMCCVCVFVRVYVCSSSERFLVRHPDHPENGMEQHSASNIH